MQFLFVEQMIRDIKIQGDSMQFLFVEQMYDRYPREHSVPSLQTKIKIQGDSTNLFCSTSKTCFLVD